MTIDDPLAIDVLTPIGLPVRCSDEYWERICEIKHPAMQGRLSDVKETLATPDEIRRSRHDPSVLLFHRRAESRWVCVVVKQSADIGFVITAYPADKVKHGDAVWTR